MQHFLRLATLALEVRIEFFKHPNLTFANQSVSSDLSDGNVNPTRSSTTCASTTVATTLGASSYVTHSEEIRIKPEVNKRSILIPPNQTIFR